MRQKPILWIAGLFFSLPLVAQPNLNVQRSGTNLFLLHKVEAKETWYSLGRLYNLTPNEIAPFNNTDLSKGLQLGQQVKIPLTSHNFSQNDSRAADEVLVPLHYIVREGEWMYRVSANNNKVPLEQLEKWNNINRNQVKAGMDLVVGHLRVKKDVSVLATANGSAIATTTTPKAPIESPKEERKIVSVNTGTPQPVSKPDPAPVFKQAEPVETAGQIGNAVDFKGGYFKNQFETSGKTSHGVANIFRSTSGWNDGKYYALMDNVAVGTIVKISNTLTNRTVYAKVLGNLSDIKENAGLAVRISNAAAAELGSGESKFSADISW